MKKVFKDITIELEDDTVFIRNSKTNDLLKARVFRAHEAVEKFEELCKVYQKKITPVQK